MRKGSLIVIPPTLSIQFSRGTKYGRLGSLHMVLVVWRICVGNGTDSVETDGEEVPWSAARWVEIVTDTKRLLLE
eukprot:2001713-Pleurochrysis_carterae.AAC.2